MKIWKVIFDLSLHQSSTQVFTASSSDALKIFHHSRLFLSYFFHISFIFLSYFFIISLISPSELFSGVHCIFFYSQLFFHICSSSESEWHFSHKWLSKKKGQCRIHQNYVSHTWNFVGGDSKRQTCIFQDGSGSLVLSC